MRFGDTYVKHDDGMLDVIRDGSEPHSDGPSAWTDVKGDEKQLKRNRFRGWFGPRRLRLNSSRRVGIDRAAADHLPTRSLGPTGVTSVVLTLPAVTECVGLLRRRTQ
jgi:hypothetical protein